MLRTIMRAGSRKARSARAAFVIALAMTSFQGIGAVAQSQPVASTGCDASASTPIPQPTQAELDAAGLGGIPLAPDSARRDLVA